MNHQFPSAAQGRVQKSRFLDEQQRQIFEENMPRELKQADVFMIAGCQDRQTSADVSNIKQFKLPDTNGAGGACTAALLKVLYQMEENPWEERSFVQVLSEMRKILNSKGFKQIPQLSSTRPIDVSKDKFDLVPETLTGHRRAVLIGINYVGHKQGQLSGCHNDVFNMYNYIQEYYGFQDEDITVLVDDGDHPPPTKANILRAYTNIVRQSQSGDAIFLHYSGHGTKVKDLNGDEDDGYDEALVPLDFKKSGLIIDDDLHDLIVKRLPQGVHVVALYDCCHSGTVLDLPYEYKANGEYSRMEISDKSFGQINKLFKMFGGAQQAMKLGKMLFAKPGGGGGGGLGGAGKILNMGGGAGGFMKQFLK